jgi:hypothetical protein
MTEATVVRGMILAYGNGATPEVFTKFAQIRDVEGPDRKKTVVDASHQQSGLYKDKAFGMIDAGKFTFDILYDPDDPSHDQTTGLGKLIEDSKPCNMLLVTNKLAPIGFWGYRFRGAVDSLKDKYPLDGMMAADCSIEICSRPEQDDIDISDIC